MRSNPDLTAALQNVHKLKQDEFGGEINSVNLGCPGANAPHDVARNPMLSHRPPGHRMHTTMSPGARGVTHRQQNGPERVAGVLASSTAANTGRSKGLGCGWRNKA